ncbi:diguanylate cyclase (GGDEF) domain-containing protein [Pseudomonas delhiensis]|uniref:diguanylate cyclase n=1 Tax=Pseudomonas delhiensis TaxID=366289 RepID=A0A239KG52_9PSED|nr:GGDEF domain-containing protein [Pseudomonas delhiensis]SDJ18269.1 diguanylate cyclase (GGDEF) domain-containing protein [Pseudomonas delhiensis]SNT17307.1 diguanylate cyclase (GGDEF) domain-containing protein [Pseudomonas delhiensis]
MSLPEYPAASGERQIPAHLRPALRAYVLQHYRGFLLAINFIAMAAYDAYVFADAALIPDMALQSLLVRGLLSLVGLLNIYLVFRHSRSVLLMDLLMPLHDIVSAIAWFELLKRSASPDVPTFLYASVVFIVLANLGVRYSFAGILACSLAISAVILGNVALIHAGEPKAVLVFTLVYLPVLVFSLFISWTNIHGVRRAFLADLEGQRQRAELAELNQRLQELAATDALTGIGNRRAFDLRLEQSWRQMRSHGRPFALLLADIDYFKPYNDHYGHPAGDRCLCEVATCMAEALRSGQAQLFRYGGEEFVILLQVASPQELRQVAERLRERVAELDIEHLHRPDRLCRLTISLGGGLSDGAAGPDELLARCDRLLYQAKQQGRDRVCLAEG